MDSRLPVLPALFCFNSLFFLIKETFVFFLNISYLISFDPHRIPGRSLGREPRIQGGQVACPGERPGQTWVSWVQPTPPGAFLAEGPCIAGWPWYVKCWAFKLSPGPLCCFESPGQVDGSLIRLSPRCDSCSCHFIICLLWLLQVWNSPGDFWLLVICNHLQDTHKKITSLT